ncbi:hypothetical protein XA68_17311 [Ophiocordyceps unilateralis]|uniref:AMP-dependent synthetase/ligase domain-containing protein n=1 Tax=Ophiocordyceps unilateralis TaxID=268505 RepID=A0A2A9P534_OPHUN|nr:hypothetical protein XA68_17311 [Ophiocordyceps unilateralis]
MVFLPPASIPELSEPPDSVSVDAFINDTANGRRALAASRNPFTCGISGLSRSAAAIGHRTDCLARALGRRLGFRPRDGTCWDRVIALYSLNAMDYFPVMHAIHRVAGIVTPVSAAFSALELESQLRSSAAVAIFTCAPLLDNARRAARAVAIPDDRIFLLPIPGLGPGSGAHASTDDLVAEAETLPPVEPLGWTKGHGARQTAYLCYSSGTSGLPKGVMISHRNIIANIMQVLAAESLPRKELGIQTQTALGVLPFSHIYGLVLCGLVGQYRGDEMVVLPRWDLDTALAAVQRHRIQQLNVVPPMLVQMMGNRERCSAYDLDSVRWVFSGAAPLGSQLVHRLLGHYPKWRVGQGYGLTESSPGVSITIETDGLVGSSGFLLPGTRAKIVDADGNEVTEYDRPGELFVQSPSVALGYFNNEKASAETFVWDDDGRWLRTGDEVLVRKSSQGNQHFFVIDRIKELIKVKGHQVAPAELEAHLLAHPFVSDCAVIPVSDEAAGEVPKAFVVKAQEATGKADGDVVDALCKHVLDHKARYKALKGGVEFVQVVPKSPSGKILRRLLRDEEAKARVRPTKEIVEYQNRESRTSTVLSCPVQSSPKITTTLPIAITAGNLGHDYRGTDASSNHG